LSNSTTHQGTLRRTLVSGLITVQGTRFLTKVAVALSRCTLLVASSALSCNEPMVDTHERSCHTFLCAWWHGSQHVSADVNVIMKGMHAAS
jgi:hypothetical protein